MQLPTDDLKLLAHRLVSEPLVHFILLGAILYGLNTYLQTHPQFSRITISSERTVQIAEHYRQQYGTLPSARQLDALVDESITEEIFYREAIKLGLDKDDEIVRRRLIQKYEFIQFDLSTPQEPSEIELRHFYNRHQERYQLPERVSFTHVYFSADRRGDAGARAATEKLASILNRQGITRAADQGDQYPGPRDFVSLSHEELARVFGREGLSREIFSIEPGRWSPPLRSGFGWHTVHLMSHEFSREATFPEVRDQVHSDYFESERTQRNAELRATLRGHFQIVRR